MPHRKKRTAWRSTQITAAYGARRFTGTFLAGLTAVLPLVITIFVVVFLGGYVYSWLATSAVWMSNLARLIFGRELSDAGLFLSTSLLYFSSLVLVVFLIWLLGYFTRLYIGKQITTWFEAMIGKIPLINTVYSSVDQVLDLFSKKPGAAKATALSTVVLMRFANTQLLGMLANTDPVDLNGVPHYLVYIPSAPMPTSGFNYLVPCADVTNINITAEELTRVIVSLGSLGPQTMNAKQPLILPVPPVSDQIEPAD
ncbi:DUF502 domain-containing protein [bacterium]|nr:DUF502 domain-containing protein [bacterium]